MSNEVLRPQGIQRLNPCNYEEDTFIGKAAAKIFGDCACCAGIRGVVYGIILSLVISIPLHHW